MLRMIRYGRPREKAGASCCQLIPETRCIDPFGDRGELKDELVLCERDLGWIDAEEEGAALHHPRVVRPDENQRLDLATLAALSDARTLVVDLGSDAAMRNDYILGRTTWKRHTVRIDARSRSHLQL